MEKNIHTDIKTLFNLLRNDKKQIVNDDAFDEIIDLFVFYMIDIVLDNDIDINEYKDSLKKKYNNLTEEQKKLLNNLDENITLNIEDIEHLLYFCNFNNFENFCKLINDEEIMNDIKSKNNKIVIKDFKNIKQYDLLYEKNFEVASKKYNIDIKYWKYIYYDPLTLYKEIRRIFHYHKLYKNIFRNEETKISEINTFEGLINNLIKYKHYKENKDFDFFGQLIESLYTDYLYGSLNNKGKGKSSKNAMGQFFTPQNITDFLIMLVKPQMFKNKKTNKINIGNFAEFACGTGGIIRSYMKWYNLLYDKLKYNKSNLNLQFLNHITGCEKSEKIFTLCAVNMIMKTGQYMKSLYCGDSIFDDCNKDENNNNINIFNKSYDYICINPPFSISWNFDNKKVNFDNNFNDFPLFVGGKNSEWLFMILTLSKLKINGKAAVIVPENNHLYETSGNYHILRELIIRCCEIHKIIRCESGTFTSTSAPTVIIYFTKKNNIEDVLSYILKKGYDFSSNIDFEEDTKTKSVSKYADIKSYVLDKNILNTKSLSFYDFKDFKDITMEDIIYNKKNINNIKPIKTIELKELEENNFSFMLNDYINKDDLQIKLNDDNINYVNIKDLIEYGKKSNKSKDEGKNKGKYKFYSNSNDEKLYCDNYDYEDEYIIMGLIRYANLKIDKCFSCSNSLLLFKTKDEKIILNKYIYYYLIFNIKILQEKYIQSMIPHITKDKFEEISVPLISIERQNKIIEYIENEIINNYDVDALNKKFNNINIFNYLLKGDFDTFKEIYDIENEIINNYDVEALNKKFNNTIKAVVFNYTNDCNNIKKLNEIVKIKGGGNVRGKENFLNGDYLVIGGGIKPCGVYTEWNTLENTVIISGVGANCGYASLYNVKTYLNNSHSLNIINKNELHYKYLYYCMKTKYNDFKKIQHGALMPMINAKDIGSVNIPLISIEKQKELIKYLDEKYDEINNKQNDKNYIMLSNYLNHLLTNYNNIPDNFNNINNINNINNNEIDINNNDEYEYFKLNYNDYVNNLSILSFHNINFDDKINDILPLFTNLKELYIINCNNISLIPNNLIYLEKLSIMNDKLPNIKYNNIENLPNSLINLKILKLSKTYIKELPNEYQNLEELEVIFSDNIKSIPKYNKLKSFTTNCNNGIGLTNIYKGQNVFLNIK